MAEPRLRAVSDDAAVEVARSIEAKVDAFIAAHGKQEPPKPSSADVWLVWLSRLLLVAVAGFLWATNSQLAVIEERIMAQERRPIPPPEVNYRLTDHERRLADHERQIADFQRALNGREP